MLGKSNIKNLLTPDREALLAEAFLDVVLVAVLLDHAVDREVLRDEQNRREKKKRGGVNHLSYNLHARLFVRDNMLT